MSTAALQTAALRLMAEHIVETVMLKADFKRPTCYIGGLQQDSVFLTPFFNAIN